MPRHVQCRRLGQLTEHLSTAVQPQPAASTQALQDPSAKAVADLAVELTAGLRLLEQGGQADLCAGFFSARHPHDPTLFLAPRHGMFWKEATPDVYGVFSCATGRYATGDGVRVCGDGPMPNFPSTAVSAAIYAAYPEINAIVHAHPASIMSLSAGDGPLGTILPMSEPSFMFYERVASLPCNFFFDDDYLDTMVEALSDGPYCIMMRNHSYIMTGKDVQEAYMRSYMVEQSATVQLKLLAATGGQLPNLPQREECLFHRRSYEGYDGCPPYDGQLEWPALLRGLDRECPEWRGDDGLRLANAFAEAQLGAVEASTASEQQAIVAGGS
jgi:ribulose-5-phosphate 4-epimerase/fuculose-1-phosphate aldolase